MSFASSISKSGMFKLAMFKFAMSKFSVSALFCCVAALLSGCASSASPNAPPYHPISNAVSAPLDVFLVRHAEKITGTADPALTAAGQARAQRLASMLKDAGIAHIHSSDYKRTRDTAAPLAKMLGLEVRIYDARQLTEFAARLQEQGGRHLVVGHSNTTPQLTELLGGDGGTPIAEATEYDRLYVVTRGTDGRAATLLLRFGEGGI